MGNTEGLLNPPGDKAGAATAECYNNFKGSWWEQRQKTGKNSRKREEPCKGLRCSEDCKQLLGLSWLMHDEVGTSRYMASTRVRE